jgi:tetratricopeptide (TPR) repeat protein
MLNASLSLASELGEHGDLAQAHRLLAEAVRLGRETDQKSLTVNALTDLARLAAITGDLRGAAAHCRDAMALSRAIPSQSREARASTACAEIATELGEHEEAELLLQNALDYYLTDKSTRAVAGTYHELAQAYLAGAKLAEARRAFDRSAAMVPQPPATRLVYDITAARLRAAEGAADDAITTLRAVVNAAASSGYVQTALEARLYLAQAERLANQPQAAEAGLERLQRDAAAKGYRLIARKAGAALDGQRAARD